MNSDRKRAPHKARACFLRRQARAIAFCFLSCAAALAGFSAEPEILLWPEGAPGLKHDRPETVEDKAETGRLDRWIGFVSKPTLTIYPATGPDATGAAMVVIPGGGFRYVCIDKEGIEVAHWLNSIGVTAAVLKYRVLDPAAERNRPALEPMFVDAKRAVRVLRQRAAEWKIAPDRIGAIGFSAGSLMAFMTVLEGDSGEPGATDPIERVSCEPSCLAMIYSGFPPGNFTERKKAFPPIFLAHAADDPKAPVTAVVKAFQFLQEKGVSCELHIFREGGHGFGVQPSVEETRSWTLLCAKWLQNIGMVGPGQNQLRAGP